MSGGAFNYRELHIEEIAECIRNIYVKQKNKKWVAWARNEDTYFTLTSVYFMSLQQNIAVALRAFPAQARLCPKWSLIELLGVYSLSVLILYEESLTQMRTKIILKNLPKHVSYVT